MGIAAWLAKSALMTSPIGGFLKRIPWQLWAVLGLVVAIWLGVRWHGHEVKKVYQSGYDQGVKDVAAKTAKALQADRNAKIAADARADAAVTQARKTHDQTTAHIGSNLADLLGMYSRAENHRGGSAVSVPGANGAAGAGRTAAPAHDGLAQDAAGNLGQPSDQLLIAVPAKGLAVRSAQCDRDYAALTAWEDTYQGYMDSYNAWRAQVKQHR